MKTHFTFILGFLVLAAFFLVSSCTSGSAPVMTDFESDVSFAGVYSVHKIDEPVVSSVLGIDTAEPMRLGFNNAKQIVASDKGSRIVYLQGDQLILGTRASNGVLTDSQVIAEGVFSLPALASENDWIALAWVERRSTTFINVVLSQDGGETFSEIETLGPGSGPSLVIKNEEVFVTWHNDTEMGESQILLSHFDGEEWQSGVQVDDSSAVPLWSAVTTGENKDIYVVWRDNKEGIYRVYLRRSLDGGATWEPVQLLINQESGDPDVCVMGSQVFVAYHQKGNLEILVSNDYGEEFGAPQALGKGWFAHLDCIEGLVGVSWESTEEPPFTPSKKVGWALLSDTGTLLESGELDDGGATAATIFVDAQNNQVELLWVLPDEKDPLMGTLRHAVIVEF